MLYKEDNFCECKNCTSVYTINGEFGYWLCCSNCDRKLEDEFHYYDEPELY